MYIPNKTHPPLFHLSTVSHSKYNTGGVFRHMYHFSKHVRALVESETLLLP